MASHGVTFFLGNINQSVMRVKEESYSSNLFEGFKAYNSCNFSFSFT